MLDTNICIYVINECDEELLERFEKHAAQICISSVTYTELCYGVANSTGCLSCAWRTGHEDHAWTAARTLAMLWNVLMMGHSRDVSRRLPESMEESDRPASVSCALADAGAARLATTSALLPQLPIWSNCSGETPPQEA